MATRPSPAQLRLLLELVAAGGRDYPDDRINRVSTVRVCRETGWIKYCPIPGQPYRIGPHEIIEAGRLAALNEDPDAYAAALPVEQVDGELSTAVSRYLEGAVPPATDDTDVRTVAAAMADDNAKITVFTSACLGEISPVRATGLAMRLGRADLTNSRPPSASVRLGGTMGTGNVADDDRESLVYADESEWMESSDDE